MGYPKVNHVHSYSTRLVLLLGVLLGLLLPGAALQAQHPDHIPVTRSASVNFASILEQTLQQSPEYLEIAARDAEAQTQADIGRSWISGRPSLQVDMLDDSLQSNLGQSELTYGVALPLWRPGERRDRQALGQQYEEQAQAWQEYFRLAVVGRLRDSLVAIHEAEVFLEVERQASADARELVSIVERLYGAGEVAERELLQARTLLLTQQRSELDAEAMLVDAQRAYTVLTGLTVMPEAPWTEAQAPDAEIDATHPQLRYMQSEIDLAQANVDRAQAEARGSPTVTLGSRREKPGTISARQDSLALSVNIPFGGKSFVAAAGSAARRDKVDAEVQYLTTLREMNLQLHEIEHELFIVGESLPLSEQHTDMSTRQWEMARTAFELGETDMSQVVIAMQQARASARELQSLSLRQQRLTIEFNQILGVLP